MIVGKKIENESKKKYSIKKNLLSLMNQNKDLFLSSYLNKQCFIVTSIFDLKRNPKKKSTKTKIFS